MAADGGDPRRLTQNDARDELPFLAPDGSRVLFMSNRDGNFEVYQVNRDGSSPQRLAHDPAWDGWASYVPAHTRETAHGAR